MYFQDEALYNPIFGHHDQGWVHTLVITLPLIIPPTHTLRKSHHTLQYLCIFSGGTCQLKPFAMAPFATKCWRSSSTSPRKLTTSWTNCSLNSNSHLVLWEFAGESFLRKVFYRIYIHLYVDLRENPWNFEQNSTKMIKYSVGERKIFPMGHNSSSKKKQIFLILHFWGGPWKETFEPSL